MMTEILAMLDACRDTREPLAIATVVRLEGSGYRRPGARMLVRPDGARIGSLSGGCLEADVAEHARRVLRSGEPYLATYDGRSGLDPVVEMGCNGSIGILIEPVTAAVVRSLEFIAGFDRRRGRGACATVFRTAGAGPLQVGDRWMLRDGAIEIPSPGGMPPPADLVETLDEVQQAGRAVVRTIHTSGAAGEAEILVEPIRSRIALVLCGAGHDALPLARMAYAMRWHVTVIDHRESLLTPERFPMAETLLPVCRLEELQPDARTAAVLMSHSYTRDLQMLRRLLDSPAGYIGLLGPHRRAEQMRIDLLEEGITIDRDARARLYGPIGLDLGAETAEEIAVSIIAEIQAALSDRPAGFLRDRAGSIHAPTEIRRVAACAG